MLAGPRERRILVDDRLPGLDGGRGPPDGFGACVRKLGFDDGLCGERGGRVQLQNHAALVDVASILDRHGAHPARLQRLDDLTAAARFELPGAIAKRRNCPKIDHRTAPVTRQQSA